MQGKGGSASIYISYTQDINSMSRKRVHHYAVRIGRIPGIYDTWPECAAQVQGYAGAIFKGFEFYEEAEKFMHGPAPKHELVQKSKPIPEIPAKNGYIPPYDRHGNPTKKDKYGYHKPRYFRKNGVQHANFGRTIGKDHELLFDESDTSIPWV